MRTEKELEGVTLLGNQGTRYDDNYNPDVLETFENKHPDNEYVVRFDCPEFTTLCPKTGQPDFGHIYISYIPRTDGGKQEPETVPLLVPQPRRLP